MRDTYWFLAFYAFLVVGAIMFIVIPAFFILAGILIGALSLYFGYSTAMADIMIIIGKFTFKHWEFFLFVVSATAIIIVSFTVYARKTSIFKRARVKK